MTKLHFLFTHIALSQGYPVNKQWIPLRSSKPFIYLTILIFTIIISCKCSFSCFLYICLTYTTISSLLWSYLSKAFHTSPLSWSESFIHFFCFLFSFLHHVSKSLQCSFPQSIQLTKCQFYHSILIIYWSHTIYLSNNSNPPFSII